MATKVSIEFEIPVMEKQCEIRPFSWEEVFDEFNLYIRMALQDRIFECSKSLLANMDRIVNSNGITITYYDSNNCLGGYNSVSMKFMQESIRHLETKNYDYFRTNPTACYQILKALLTAGCKASTVRGKVMYEILCTFLVEGMNRNLGNF